MFISNMFITVHSIKNCYMTVIKCRSFLILNKPANLSRINTKCLRSYERTSTSVQKYKVGNMIIAVQLRLEEVASRIREHLDVREWNQKSQNMYERIYSIVLCHSRGVHNSCKKKIKKDRTLRIKAKYNIKKLMLNLWTFLIQTFIYAIENSYLKSTSVNNLCNAIYTYSVHDIDSVIDSTPNPTRFQLCSIQLSFHAFQNYYIKLNNIIIFVKRLHPHPRHFY